MNKLFAILAAALALAACSATGTHTMGNTSANPAETRNSTDANKSGNPAAVSPGSGPGGAGSAGAGAGGSGAGAGTR
jgi:hypothetical protein